MALEKDLLAVLDNFDKALEETTTHTFIDYDKVIEEGTYVVKPIKVSEWESKKGAYVILKNDKGEWVDEQGEPIVKGTAPVRVFDENLVYLSKNITFEILEGEFKGRYLFHRIDTIKDDAWKITPFLEALRIAKIHDLTLDTIKDEVISVKVKHGKTKEIEKEVVNENTGITKIEVKEYTPLYLTNPVNNSSLTRVVKDDLGTELGEIDLDNLF